MHVLTHETEYAFFSKQVQAFPCSNAFLAIDDPSLVHTIPLQPKPMAAKPQPKQKEPKLTTKQTKRGKGKKKSGNNEPLSFSLLGSNSNGLKAKLDSLKNNVSIFKKPSCVTIQETKFKQSRNIELPGYQVFQLNRIGSLGGGLLTAVDVNLSPVLVAVGDEALELLVVQVKVGHMDIRIFNAYGLQQLLQTNLPNLPT